MRIAAVSLTVLIAAVVLGLGSAAATPRPCPGTKPGWWVQCGPASAVVTVRGVTHTIPHGACNGHGGRPDFGIYSQSSKPHIGFGLRLDTVRAGAVKVIDGELDVVPGFRVALSGTAHLARGLRSGTFSVHARGADSRLAGHMITGRWTCG
jgi:hypothetical protein